MPTIQIRKTSEEPGAASLAVTVPVEQVREAEDRVVTAYQRRARLPGFRKGKAPAAIVKKHFADDIRQETLQELIRTCWKVAVEQESLKPVADPHIHNLKWDVGAPVTFEFHVEVKPDITLGRLGGFQLKRTVRRVTDEQVAAQLKEVREQKAPWTPVSGEKPQPKDLVHVTIAAREGAQLKDAQPYQVVLGEGRAIPLVERALWVFAQAYGIPEDRMSQFATEFRPVAEAQVRRDLVLDYVVEHEKLQASEAELDQRIQELAARREMPPEQLYASLEKAKRLRDVERSITEEKVFAFLLSQSTVEQA